MFVGENCQVAFGVLLIMALIKKPPQAKSKMLATRGAGHQKYVQGVIPALYFYWKIMINNIRKRILTKCFVFKLVKSVIVDAIVCEAIQQWKLFSTMRSQFFKNRKNRAVHKRITDIEVAMIFLLLDIAECDDIDPDSQKLLILISMILGANTFI